MKTLFKAGTLAAAIIALNACEVAPQDGGDNISKKFSGTVIDGRVAGGKVWVDRNDNDKWDDFEPYAFTDEDGVYSFNPDLNGQPRDYCTTAGDDGEANLATNFRNCLTVFTTADAFKIKVKGGIDTTTGEELKGLMAMDEAFEDGEVEIATSSAKKVLSPITTLLANTPAESKEAVKTALGISSDDDLKVDYTSDNTKRQLFATAVAAQTVLSSVANASIAATTDASSSDYEAAQKSAASALVSALSSGTKLTDMTSSELQSVASTAASSFASEKGAAVDTTKATKAAERVAVAVSTLKAAADDDTTTVESFAATLKVSETITKLAEKEARGDAGAVTALDSLTDEDNPAARDALKSALEGAESDSTSVDLTTVVESLASGGDVTSAVESSLVDLSSVTDLDQFIIFRYLDEVNMEVADGYIALKMGHSRDGKDVEVCAAIDNDGTTESIYLNGDFLEVNGTYILNTLWAGTLDVDLVMKKPVVQPGDPQYAMNGLPLVPYIFKPGEALLQAAEDEGQDISDFMENKAYAQTSAVTISNWNDIPLSSNEDCSAFAEAFPPSVDGVTISTEIVPALATASWEYWNWDLNFGIADLGFAGFGSYTGNSFDAVNASNEVIYTLTLTELANATSELGLPELDQSDDNYSWFPSLYLARDEEGEPLGLSVGSYFYQLSFPE